MSRCGPGGSFSCLGTVVFNNGGCLYPARGKQPKADPPPKIPVKISSIGEPSRAPTLGADSPGAVQQSPGTLGFSAAEILTLRLATRACIFTSLASGTARATSFHRHRERSTTRPPSESVFALSGGASTPSAFHFTPAIFANVLLVFRSAELLRFQHTGKALAKTHWENSCLWSPKTIRGHHGVLPTQRAFPEGEGRGPSPRPLSSGKAPGRNPCSFPAITASGGSEPPAFFAFQDELLLCAADDLYVRDGSFQAYPAERC